MDQDSKNSKDRKDRKDSKDSKESKDRKSSKEPALRFKGFDGEWEEKKLGEIGNTYSGLSGKTKSDFGHGDARYITYLNVFANPITDPKMTEPIEIDSKQNEVEIGDVFFTTSSETPEEVGMSSILLEKQGHTYLNSFCFGYRPSIDIDKHYLAYMLRSKFMREQIIFLAQGISRYNISKNKVMDISIPLPAPKEQMLIGQYLSYLDRLVFLQQQKLNKLEDFKKAMLDKMFPQRGSRVPEIRFQGFIEPWETKQISELVQIERGGSPRPIEDYITQSADGLNWVKIGDAPKQGHYITKTAEKIRPEGLAKTREVHVGDLILSNSMSFGRPYIMGIDGCIHDGWLLIRNTYNAFDLIFLCYLLASPQMLQQYKALAAGSTVNNLNKDLVNSAVTMLPNINEQKAIGTFFSHLDRLISLNRQKLEKLQSLKKAMLEQMFPASPRQV